MIRQGAHKLLDIVRAGIYGVESNTELSRSSPEELPDPLQPFTDKVSGYNGSRSVAQGQIDVHTTHRPAADDHRNTARFQSFHNAAGCQGAFLRQV